MHPIIQSDLAKARIAELHRQAERDRMARAAGLARKTHHRRFAPGQRVAVVARRVLAVLTAHSPPAGPAPDRRTARIEGGTS